jgi:cytoskeletal protein CcmA (bactofilin family)
MFGKKENNLTTVIGADSSFRGDLQSKGTIRIDGICEGALQADWVIVGETGSIKGEVSSRGIAVGGRVEGSIQATELCEITPKGSVKGDIYSAKLSVAEGGAFEGRSFMGKTKEADKKSGVLPLIHPEK